ncbi:MAG: nicotinate phosphoribosyltransferase [Verrucomicrobia bacterium]|nr:nicotinate phosphoribosyltransferase [Verrucomicrobiota bacterium]
MHTSSLALLTDPYELTMAYGYWKLGMHDLEAVFHLFYRTAPFKGAYAVAAGLQSVIDLIENFHFSSSDCTYLASLCGVDGQPLFEPPFLDFLQKLELKVDLDAVEEGNLAFPHAPLLRVKGPLLQVQILETALLNAINFQTLIATKAARLRHVAPEDEIIEFGLRRAQGIDGGMSASRAAYLGGCDAVSNLLAGKKWAIPVRGTHAHSWVMAFDSELEAFKGYVQVMPNNCVLLVDTYGTQEGIKHAICAAKDVLRAIRLDSGDLEQLSKQARHVLDQEGLQHVKIIASNELDEWRIKQLKSAHAPIDIWGVGTRLTTGHPDGALDGVYKLSAVRNSQGKWRYAAKKCDQKEKGSPPGILQVRRYADGDAVVDVKQEDAESLVAWNVKGEKRQFSGEFKEMLTPIFRHGHRCYTPPPLKEIRLRAIENVQKLPLKISRFEDPTPYFVGTEEVLYRSF